MARCCWCGQPFVRATVGNLGCWVCGTSECLNRCLKHAVIVTLKGKEKQCLYVPLPRQVEFLETTEPYVLFGGAAGGSKSHALRWLAYIKCLSVSNFRVLLLRRTYKELEQTHLREAELDAPKFGASSVPSAKVVRFPNGSVLQFGHCETAADAANYLSAEYDLILFDELVTFEETPFLLISSRARTTKGLLARVLAGSNPGGPQSHWVRSRFMDRNVDREQYPDYDEAEWRFIQSKLEDNPYLDQSYERKLAALPPELRKAYRDGDWDIFPGQYFPEWRRAMHVTPEHIAYPREWRRTVCMDWGFVKAGYCGWVVHEPEGGAYLEQEYVPVRVTASEQGKEIGRRTVALGLKKILLVYDTQMETPAADSGEPIIESVCRGIRKAGVTVTPIKADKDRINGWARLRQWLGLRPDGRPWLQVSPSCGYAIRTIPAQVSDEHDPEDLDTDGEDHAVDSLRYFVMSRPAAGGMKPEKPRPGYGTLGWYKAQDSQPVGVLARRH